MGKSGVCQLSIQGLAGVKMEMKVKVKVKVMIKIRKRAGARDQGHTYGGSPFRLR